MIKETKEIETWRKKDRMEKEDAKKGRGRKENAPRKCGELNYSFCSFLENGLNA